MKRPNHPVPHFLLFTFAFCLLFLLSCTTQKELTYLQDIDQADFYKLARPEYHLQKQDILYVEVSTLNGEMATLLQGNAYSSNQNINMTQGSAYLRGLHH